MLVVMLCLLSNLYTFTSLIQAIPVLIGVGVVAVTAILAKVFFFGKKKSKAPVTLKDPMVKVPLKLIDKEVSFFKFSTCGYVNFLACHSCCIAEYQS